MKKLLILPLMMLSESALSIADFIGEDNRGFLRFSTQDERVQMQIDGRIMLDFGALSSKTNAGFVPNNDFRRLRLSFKSLFEDVWGAEFDVAFERNRIRARDMWLAYQGIDNWVFRFGHHKPAFSLAQVTTSRWYSLVEIPSVVEAFEPGRRIGFSATHYTVPYFVSVTLFGDEADVDGSDAIDDANGQAERFGYASRILGRYRFAEQHVTHFGINLLDHGPQSEDELTFEYDIEPESRIANYELMKTGDLENVDRIKVQGVEWLYRKDNWYIQAEYLKSDISFSDGSANYESDGYYIQGSYFLYGNGQKYQLHDAELEQVNPSGKNGDLEFILRYGELDLNDPDVAILGGQVKSLTLGVNWYVNLNIVFRFNYIDSDFDEFADGDGDFIGNESLKIYALRTQILF